MLEKLNDPKYRNLRRPDADVVRMLRGMLNENAAPIVGEIGVGVGATSLQMAELLANRGELHLFDRELVAPELARDLTERGFTNIVAHANSSKPWDSYNWSLMKLIQDGKTETFDMFYIDGAHTLFHDGLAFVLCDRLLKVGGHVIFDDYGWTFAASKTTKAKGLAHLTEEQCETPQIKLVVENLVAKHSGYEPVDPPKLFRKIASIWRG